MKYIEKLCENSLCILADYYHFKSIPTVKDFIFPLSQNNHDSSQILFHESKDEIFICLQFSNKIFDEIDKINKNDVKKYISLNTAAIISEETSHFKLILDAAKNSCKVSLLDIETLGEIDRFLCLMHWNQKNHWIKISEKWQNIHDLCDRVFQGNRFKNENRELYIKAENKAFYHLKQAFAYEWDYSWFNFSQINCRAAHYLKALRDKILFSQT